jgi:LuxR family transcriptional regulator, maltose regulon positive regulatory protein
MRRTRRTRRPPPRPSLAPPLTARPLTAPPLTLWELDRPELTTLALVSVDPEAAEDRLRDAERLLDMTPQAGERPEPASVEMVVHDVEGFRSQPGMIAIVRAYRAGAQGDVAGIVDHAERAWDLLPEDDQLWRGAAGGLLGLAHWTSGNLEAAYRAFSDAWATLQMAGDIAQEIGGAFVLADIGRAQGRLREAARLYEQALQRAAGQGDPMPPPAADLYVGLSELCYEHGDLEGANRHLQRSAKLSEHGGISEHRHRWYVAMAHIMEAGGDLDGALDLLDEAQRLYVSSPAPDVRPIATFKARMWVRQGRLAEALGWARERGLSVDDTSAIRVSLSTSRWRGCSSPAPDAARWTAPCETPWRFSHASKRRRKEATGRRA